MGVNLARLSERNVQSRPSFVVVRLSIHGFVSQKSTSMLGINTHILMVRHQLWHITRILQHWHMSFFLVLLMQIRVWGGLGGNTKGACHN